MDLPSDPLEGDRLLEAAGFEAALSSGPFAVIHLVLKQELQRRYGRELDLTGVGHLVGKRR